MTTINQSFKAHLEKNKRVLFSGPFGVGKSYFLNDYFNTKENKEIFEVFNIYPVNFHISNNEDVVKLIKYQIIRLLIEKEYVDFKNIESQNWFKATKSLAKKELIGISKIVFGTIASAGLSKIGLDKKVLDTATEKFEKLLKEKQEADSSILKTKDFISETKSEWFAFDEDEFLTYFIRESLKNEKYKAKQKVLVIDDLDRLDPEHIFRILNIFSAFNTPDNHSKKLETDSNEENSVSESLFGFDKVILVADLHNLESVYHHKFGEKTDFQGYINKFYTSEPFFFDNELLQREFSKTLLPKFTSVSSYELFILYRSILYKLIEFNHFTYRQFLYLTEKVEKQYSVNGSKIFTINLGLGEPQHKNYSKILENLTEILLEIYGTKSSLIIVIKKLKSEDSSQDLEHINLTSTWEDYFLKALLIDYYNKLDGGRFGKELSRHKYKIFGEDRPKYYDLEVPSDSSQIDKRWNDNDPEFSSKIKNIHSFRDIWDLYLNYLEAN